MAQCHFFFNVSQILYNKDELAIGVKQLTMEREIQTNKKIDDQTNLQTDRYIDI